MENQKDQPAWHGDEFHGQGGSYVVENGKRTLVERTEIPEPNAPQSGDQPKE